MTHPANNLRVIRRRLSKARRFPTNTCASSRALQTWAETILHDGDFRSLDNMSREVAECMLAVVADLWEMRREMGDELYLP